MKRLLFLVNIACILALLLAYASPYVSPETWYIPQLTGLVYKYILLANIAFVIFWLFLQKRYVKYSLVAILLGFGFISREYKWSGENAEKEEKSLKILTYNVRKFNTKPKELFEFIKEQKANLLCFQEYNKVKYKRHGKPRLQKQLPHHFAIGEVAIFSKYPLTNKENIEFKKGQYVSGIQADIIVKMDTIRVINVHLESNRLDSKNKQDVENFVQNKERDFSKLKSIGRKLKNSSLHRAGQVAIIAKIIEESPHSVILCGDFNDIPMSYSYQRIRNLLDDSFVESGKGDGKTFTEKSIKVRIDYIFSNLKMTNHEVHKVDFSDHKPISSTIGID